MKVPREFPMHAILFAGTIFVSAIFVSASASTAATRPMVKVGEKAPLFSLENIPGQTIHLAKLRGQKVLLVVGMSKKSAPHCRDWMKALLARYAQNAQNPHLLQVVVTDNSWYIPKWLVRKKLKEFAGKKHHSKMLIEWGLGFAQRYGIKKDDTPTVISIDEAGIIRWRHHGRFTKTALEKLTETLKKLQKREKGEVLEEKGEVLEEKGEALEKKGVSPP
ncbi:MAG: redoxin domain-containing protein [Deltaproteobacteria bacterium]|nr:redoxin domain-containing protein [Deltaproteobacteria bacterium]